MKEEKKSSHVSNCMDCKCEPVPKMTILRYMMIPIGILNLFIMGLVISILAYSFYIKKD